MIINIPLQIDEQRMEEVLQRDYSNKVLDRIEDYIKKTLSENAEKYYGDKVADGMRVLIEMQIDKFLKVHRDEIIEIAAKDLAIRLARSKNAKKILGDLCDG